MTEHKNLRDHTSEVTIRPALGNRLRVIVEDNLFDESRVAWGVSVYGDGRIYYHDEADRHDDAITNEWARELAKVARDLRSEVPCAFEGDWCIPHHWDRRLTLLRCPQERLAVILDALESTQWRTAVPTDATESK